MAVWMDVTGCGDEVRMMVTAETMEITTSAC
jgi:hypothetical protein